MDTKEYRIPDRILSDLVNAALTLRYMSEHYPRLDYMGRGNLDDAVTAINALVAIADQQHPVELPTSQIRIIQADQPFVVETGCEAVEVVK